jgi:hypothetical protein
MTSSLTHYAIEAAALSVSEIHFNSRYSSRFTLRNQPISTAIVLQRSPARTAARTLAPTRGKTRATAHQIPGVKPASFKKFLDLRRMDVGAMNAWVQALKGKLAIPPPRPRHSLMV